jgi:hypothetical protein
VTGHNLTVRRLRWREPGPNRLAARHRLELALEAGGNASALKPEAILCVRRIATSFPDLDRLSNVLDAEIRDAARPARGTVPANANAVLFADRAELLACLARDWCAADLGISWWWPILFPRDDFTALVRRWLADAAAIPAALTRLDVAGMATPFLRKIAPDDLDALWRKVVQTFGLAELERTWSSMNLNNEVAPGVSREAAPWSPWISPESTLSTSATRLLVTAVLLERAPAKARSHSFARAVAAWTESNNDPRAQPLDSANETLVAGGDAFATPAPAKDARTPGGTKTVLARPPPPDVERRTPDAGDGAVSTRIESSDNLPPAVPRATPAPPPIFPNGSPLHDRGLEDRSETGLRAAFPNDPGESALLPDAPQQDCIATEWGGVLYLVNLALAAGLYPDFTAPGQAGLALPLWDFLALLGERMIGEKFIDDPLPGFLARLSCRAPEDRPGAEFEPPTGEPLDCWVARICDDFAERVRRSIGPGASQDFCALLLNHGAKIEASSTRIDAHFSLATHPIELRLAGLDRDPGWVPAGGRAIYFHYD